MMIATKSVSLLLLSAVLLGFHQLLLFSSEPGSGNKDGYGLMIHGAYAKKVHIPDDLHDVVDDEEDEEWKEWGKPKAKEPPPFDPPPDLSNLQPEQIKQEVLKRHMGTAMGFVKLRLDQHRTKDDITLIAKKWTNLLRTGAIEAKIMAVDTSTIMFIIEDGQEISQVKDFFLDQPEAYEFKIGNQEYRRPGDPPLEVVIERLRKEKEAAKESKGEL